MQHKMRHRKAERERERERERDDDDDDDDAHETEHALLYRDDIYIRKTQSTVQYMCAINTR